MLLTGLMMGFAVAAPVGPIGVLCISHSLNRGWRSGWLAGMGAATADLLYGLAAVLGLSLLLSQLQPYHDILRFIGVAFLLYLAWGFWRQNHSDAAKVSGQRIYFSTFLLTLLNPATFLSFMAMVTALPADAFADQKLVFVLGVFLGSAAWWLVLATLASKWSGRIQAAIINKLAALALSFLALTLLWLGLG